ncbi:hypothetical protein B0H17DRAFT_1145647 [Mycena rosella]|uniref:Uncharacterized protein n=1 Tax=Mycena rosella TaxID=1033263 RepID=A0AAD7G1K4_MYCRO|nr:hypothetical protein B0H17DRAFT_1145647 [Mycena rosella]
MGNPPPLPPPNFSGGNVADPPTIRISPGDHQVGQHPASRTRTPQPQYMQAPGSGGRRPGTTLTTAGSLPPAWMGAERRSGFSAAAENITPTIPAPLIRNHDNPVKNQRETFINPRVSFARLRVSGNHQTKIGFIWVEASLDTGETARSNTELFSFYVTLTRETSRTAYGGPPRIGRLPAAKYLIQYAAPPWLGHLLPAARPESVSHL